MRRLLIPVFCSVVCVLLASSGCTSAVRLFPWTPRSTVETAPRGHPPREPDVLGGVISSDSEAVITAGSDVAPAEGAPKPAPLVVAVSQAFFVGEELHIKVRLEAKTVLPAAQVVVSVLGLREGQIVETHYQVLNTLTKDERIVPGQTFVLPFALLSKDLSEYQIQCRWGNDAVQLLSREHTETPVQPAESAALLAAQEEPGSQRAALSPAAAIGKLALEDVELEEQTLACAHAPCDRLYTLRARLINKNTAALGDLELAVGLAWSETNSLPKPPADYAPKQEREELIRLGTVVLHTGESKKLKIKVARSVPYVPGGAFLPYIRLVHAEQRSS